MIVDEEVYLEHFGVKGQKWGIRNKSKRDNESPKDRKKRHAKNISRVATGVKLAGVGLFIYSLLASNGNTRVHASNNNVYKTKSVSDLINDRRNVEMSSLKRMHKEGKMDAEQLANFSKILNARYDRKVAAAVKK